MEEVAIEPLTQEASTPVNIFIFVVEGASVGHAVGQKHSLGIADFQYAPFDGSVGKVMPAFCVSPSVVLLAIRRTSDSP